MTPCPLRPMVSAAMKTALCLLLFAASTIGGIAQNFTVTGEQVDAARKLVAEWEAYNKANGGRFMAERNAAFQEYSRLQITYIRELDALIAASKQADRQPTYVAPAPPVQYRQPAYGVSRPLSTRRRTHPQVTAEDAQYAEMRRIATEAAADEARKLRREAMDREYAREMEHR